jgi:putative nucleotidyltransferase with HDIG domain
VAILLQEMIADAVKLASLPDIVQRLEAAINDPTSNMSDFADIISADPALAARTLRIANSALFNFPAQVDTVSYAISIIGTKQLRDLVFASCVIDVFRGVFIDGVNMDSFWRHSIASGIVARVIATYRREQNVERFYLLGLLHDIGKLVTHMRQPEEAKQAIYKCREDKIPLYLAEEEIFGFNHAEVGGHLLRAWHLPEPVCEPVLYHHHPWKSESFPDETALIHFADIMSHSLLYSDSNFQSIPPLDNQAWERINIPESQIDTITVQIDNLYQEVTQLFLNGTS